MAEKPVHETPDNPDFARRRAEARDRLDAIDPARTGKALQDPYRRDWFAAVYDLAEGDAANVPWGNLAANPLLRDWLDRQPRFDGLRALDVGSGLGDNAAALAAHGADVTGFDLVPAAAQWAQSRFPVLKFHAADLFDPPPDWRESFDLVNEIYTLQALPAELLPQAREALAGLLKRGGRLLAICRARDEDQAIEGPPWPLRRSDLLAFEPLGLKLLDIEDIPPGLTASRHWRAVFQRG